MSKKRICMMSIIIPSVCILWSFLFYKLLFLHGILISLDDAQTHLVKIICQHIVVNLPIFILLIFELRKKEREKFYLILPPKKLGKIFLGLEFLVYIGLFAYGFSIKSDFVHVLYVAVFYLFMISFLEEYVYRGWMPAILNNAIPKWAVWILPNLIFTLSHYVMLFVDDTGINGISVSQLLIFFISTMIFGVLMELIKRKSQSLWIVVLLHAIYDFYGEIMLWI